MIVDLSPRNRLGGQLANTIGALLINEIIAQVRSLPRDVRYRTYMFLDEFQNFVGPDLEAALPELRNLGLRLILSHQSFSQLERGDYDMRGIIFQAQSRMIFGVQGEDADLLAHEVASIKFDARKIKEELYSLRQITVGHHKETLRGTSHQNQSTDSWSDTSGKSSSDITKGYHYSRYISCKITRIPFQISICSVEMVCTATTIKITAC